MGVRLKWIIVAAAVFLVGPATALAGQTLTLSDGKSVEILAAGPLQSTQGWSAFMLKYRTSISVTEIPKLQQEVNQIWECIVGDVERAGFKAAIISANEPETGFIIHSNRSYNFVFKKQDDGTWRMQEPKP